MDKKSNSRRRHEQGILMLGKNIRKQRKAQHLTITQLANQAEIQYKHLQQIETGEINVTVSMVFIIANALGIDVNLLFVNED